MTMSMGVYHDIPRNSLRELHTDVRQCGQNCCCLAHVFPLPFILLLTSNPVGICYPFLFSYTVHGHFLGTGTAHSTRVRVLHSTHRILHSTVHSTLGTVGVYGTAQYRLG